MIEPADARLRCHGHPPGLYQLQQPDSNAEAERFLRSLKEEFVWLREWASPALFFMALKQWIAAYDTGYLHSALG